METADDHSTVGGLSRDLSCDICCHLPHLGYCADYVDDLDRIRCPCHAPIPGSR